jgi:metal-responsive CopG/Arc/MetJ family transcriptional regulator
MHTETLRINVTLSKELLKSVNDITGSRSRSRLIAESLQKYVRKIKKAELEKQLQERYRAAAKESIALTEEFAAVDLERWDEYYKRQNLSCQL